MGRAGATGWAAGKKEPLGFAGGNGPEGEEKELGRVGLLGWFEFGLGFLGFFSILFPLPFLFLNQTKFEFQIQI